MKELIEQIKLKADSIQTNTKENRRVKGAYVDCLMMAKEVSKNLVKPAVSCWAIVLNSLGGCEADATETRIMAVFTTKEKAMEYEPILTAKINWKHYYHGELEIEEIPFEPCS